MTSRQPQIWVESDAFPVQPGEDEHTNPGRYGLAFSQWIAGRLRAEGEVVQDVIAEDFGWCVLLGGHPFRLWVGCGNEDESTTRWGAFVVAEPSLSQRLFNRVDTNPALEKTTMQLRKIMKQAPGAVRTWEESVA